MKRVVLLLGVVSLLLFGGVVPLPTGSTEPPRASATDAPRVAHPTEHSSVGAKEADLSWPTYLYDNARTGANLFERSIAPANVSQLRTLWSVPSNGSDFSAPIVVNNTVYYGSWNGYEYAVGAANGTVLWKRYLGTDDCGYTPQGISSTPSYVNGTLYLGGGDGTWYALNATNGSVDWTYYVGDHTVHEFDWASSLVYRNSLYIGVASCFDSPLIRGKLLDVNLSGNHSLLHEFDVVPAADVGGCIWTTPAVDAATNTIWVSTGNEDPSSGYPPHTNAIVALNATTLNLTGSWQVPGVQGQDSDFGSTPNLFTTPSGLPLVVATNKNGVAYALNRSNVTTNGSWGPIWSLATGGGFSSGAYDGHTLYLAGGSELYAVDPANGSVRWNTSLSGGVYGSLTWANGLVFVGAGSDVEAVDAASGATLWDQPIPGFLSTVTEPVVDEGRVYVASGDYSTAGNLTAYGLPFSGSAAGAPVNGTVPLVVNFTAAPRGGMPPYSIAWKFGDGTTGVGAAVTHTYTIAGDYSAEVWMNDSAGTSLNRTIAITAAASPRDPGLIATILASTHAGLAPLSVTFAGNALNGSWPPYAFAWNFGDGSTETGSFVAHTFVSPSAYTVRLQVTDSKGNLANASTTITAFTALNVSATESASSVTAGVDVAFMPNVTGGLPPYRYAWTFGDGTAGSSLVQPTHAYAVAGNYTVQLTVTDALGDRQPTSLVVMVTPVPLPLGVGASYSFVGGSGCGSIGSSPVQVRLVANATGGVAPLTYAWKLSDGSSARGAVVLRNDTIPITWARLTVTDSLGAANSTNLTIGTPLTPCPPPAPYGPNLDLEYEIVGGALLASLLLVGVLLAVRRRGPPGDPPPGT